MKAIIVFFDSLNRRYLPGYQADCGSHAPNFVRLGEHTLTFDNAYVGSMPCMPARRELHTGRHNFLHREWGPLEPFDDSMPEILKNHGIYTHLISDHLHYWEDGGSNYHTRYSSWEVVRGQEGDHWKGHVGEVQIPEVAFVPRQQTGTKTASGWRYDWVNREYIRQEKEFPQNNVFDLGCEFMDTNHGEDNWLLQIETFDPHEPFYAPEKYHELYPEEYSGRHFDWPRGEAVQSEEEVEHCRNRYRALLSMCDSNLGRVLDRMDQYDMWKDTLLIVGTDHGFLLGEHGYWGKNQMPYYNEIAHVPFFLWDPRAGICNERRTSLVQLMDWAPTVLSFFHQEIPKDMQGKDLLETAREDKPVREAAIYGVFSGHVNITDGHTVYMRAAHPDRINEVFQYTLMPAYMTRRMPVRELLNLELAEPFPFTKGCKLLKVPSGDNYNVNRFGTLLFDIDADPEQLHPLDDSVLEEEMILKLRGKLKEHEAPPEQFYRLDITDDQSGGQEIS